MSKNIHPQAMVDSAAKIGEGVRVGPYAIISGEAEIGKGTIVEAFAQILGETKVGDNCHIFSQAVVGSIPQDLKYRGEKSYLVIGNNNRIREFVTINPGTEKNAKTVVGDDNLVMAYSHIAHDCLIGDGNVLANGATLAGHVEIGKQVVIGGLVAVHQFCRLGDHSIVGGCSKVVKDIPPYSMCDGHPAVIKGLNSIGLKRKKLPPEKVKVLRKAFKILFFEGHSFAEAIKIVSEAMVSVEEVRKLLDFIGASKRGVSKKQ